MMIAKCGIMHISSIFITHFHADHILGIPGLIQTLSFNKREEPLTIYGPVGIEGFVRLFTSLGNFRLGFDVVPVEVSGGDTIMRDEYRITVFNTVHGVPSVGYALIEDERPGRFNRERAISLGVPPGPLFRKLHHGESVEINGKIVKSEEVVGAPRRGRKIVCTGDTRPTDEIVRAAAGADVLIHDASMANDLVDWAHQTKHSTAGEAARIAAEACVNQLILTHISARYSDNTDSLIDDAKHIFENTIVAHDMMELIVPYSK